MKSKIFILMVMVPLYSIGQLCDPYHYGILKANVTGDAVTLRDDTANRNCGVHYEMQVVRSSSDTLIWRQVDFGSPAACNCFFNLSVTIDSLSPGSYFAKVYYTDSTLFYQCYVGLISFNITQTQVFPSFTISGESQSDCFPVTNINDQDQGVNSLSILPNPSAGVFTFRTSMKGLKTITITNLLSKVIFKYQTDKEEDQLDLSEFPDSYYVITIENRRESIHKTICKMK